MFGSFMNVFFVPLLKVDYFVITDLLDERVLVTFIIENEMNTLHATNFRPIKSTKIGHSFKYN
jgi:hypothetical protein